MSHMPGWWHWPDRLGRRLVIEKGRSMMSNPQTEQVSGVSSARDDLIAEIIDRYISGQSIRAVAAAIKRSYGLVQGVLKEAGVALRSPGAQQRGAAMAAHPSAGEPGVAQPDESDRVEATIKKNKTSDKKTGKPNNKKAKGSKKAMSADTEAVETKTAKKAKGCDCQCGCKKCKCGKNGCKCDGKCCKKCTCNQGKCTCKSCSCDKGKKKDKCCCKSKDKKAKGKDKKSKDKKSKKK